MQDDEFYQAGYAVDAVSPIFDEHRRPAPLNRFSRSATKAGRGLPARDSTPTRCCASSATTTNGSPACASGTSFGERRHMAIPVPDHLKPRGSVAVRAAAPARVGPPHHHHGLHLARRPGR